MKQLFPTSQSRSTSKHVVMQHDNARAHKSAIVETFLKNQNVSLIEWPAQSPDLNPMESIWAAMMRKLQGNIFTSKALCWNAVQQAWNDLTKEEIKAIVQSMPRRLSAVKKSHGYHTPY